MRMITLHEADWKLSKIDALVKEGVFSSRAEAYRSGALMMIYVTEAQKLAKLDKLDADLFGKEVKICLDSLHENRFEIAREKLDEISDTLRLRSIISPILQDPNKDAFLTMSDTLKRHSESLSKFESLTPDDREILIEDIKREMSILHEYLKFSQSELVESREERIKPEMMRLFHTLSRLQQDVIAMQPDETIGPLDISKPVPIPIATRRFVFWQSWNRETTDQSIQAGAESLNYPFARQRSTSTLPKLQELQGSPISE